MTPSREPERWELAVADCARFRFVAEADTKAALLLFADCGQGICAGDALAFGASGQPHQTGVGRLRPAR